MNNLVLGLDIGIGSIGWMLYNQSNQKMVDMGVSIFESATQAKEARNHRSARRNLRHKNWRKRQMIQAFVDFGFIDSKDIFLDNNQKEINVNYLSFGKNQNKKDSTIYHLRNRALTEEVSIRELFLALYNICKTRGHFLLETVDFENTDSISFDIFKESFYSLVEDYVDFADKIDFEKSVLLPIFNQTIKVNTLKKEIKIKNFTIDDKNDKALQEICLLICNNKADLNLINPSVQLKENSKKVNINDLLKAKELNDFLKGCIELYDVKNVAAILQEYNYICQKDVALLETVKEVYHKKDMNDPDFKNDKKKLQSKMVRVNNNYPDRIRAVKNIENKFPNGLYVKEAKAILKKQQEYNSMITDEFIDICLDIIKSRIPYYVGPLGENARNGWVEKKGNFKYSYNYSKDSCVDESLTIEKWKKRMISHCTYLTEEYALPKGSFIAETFSIINELNNLDCVDLNENDHYLTSAEKYKVFDLLFLKEGKLFKYEEVANVLNLKSVSTHNKGTIQKFKVGYSLYHQIVNLLPELRLKSITEIFSQSEKINKIEEIVMDINLFDEEDSSIKHFIKLGYSEDISKKLSKLKSKGFYSFSKAFILETSINESGRSLLEELFEDNTSSYRNEQMTLISNAKDINGNPIDFSSNKYEEKFRNGEILGINLLLEDGKPVIPISREVVRALNECLKLYNTVTNMYGVPDRVVIETARELKDSSQTGEIQAKHYNKMEDCYNDIFKQLSEHKQEFRKSYLEDWDTISTYLETNNNKRKIELYIRQNGRDMISGEKIDIHNLLNYEIDHILPRGFGDDSMDNKMLINKQYNSLKNNRVPLMYIEDGAYEIKTGNPIIQSDYENRVHELFKLGLISENKHQRLLLKNTAEVEGFINRNLVDTRYIIREFMSILRAYNKVNNYDTHISALKSAFTDTFRRAFYINKNRKIGDQHHALDAATLVLADQILNTYYPNYDQRGNFSAYQNLIKSMNNIEKNETRDNVIWIQNMYKKTFKHDLKNSDSLLNEIKNTTPLYSIKTEKNYTGEFFKATIYSPKMKRNQDENKLDPLVILGVNDERKAFSTVYCAAVDFYKCTDQKGHKKHIAIHIPKVIIDSKGNINKEKYLRLIRDYYKASELLDENGELKTYLFRLRVFKNDLIYDTKNNVIQKFNIGSIAKKILEMKHIYNFAYNDIYNDFGTIKHTLVDAFNIKDRINKNKNEVPFEEIDKNKLIRFCIDNLMAIEDLEKYEDAIYEILTDEKTLNSFIEKIAFLNLIVNRKCTPKSITKQYTPAANNPKFDENSQYVKLKYSPLGIRYSLNESNKLLIQGPKYHEYAYSKIKKEDFSWRICTEVI